MSIALSAAEQELSKPVLGDTIRSDSLGLTGRKRMIWTACIDCGKERWVHMKHGKPQSGRCYDCGIRWVHQYLKGRPRKLRGGGKYKSNGYTWILIKPDDFFYPMTNKKGYILEHRLVMAKSLTRLLEDYEIVHHKNHIRDDNRLENLLLLPSASYHMVDLKVQEHIKQLEKKILNLELENILLRKGGG